MMDASGTHIADARPMNWSTQAPAAAPCPMRSWRGWTGPLAGGCCCCRAGGAWRWRRSRGVADWPNLWHALLFLVGAIVMRGAGCTLNDMADRDFDAAVTRTKNRPIASGRVSRAQAFVFLALQSLVGLVVLLQFNWFTVFCGCSVAADRGRLPFMKLSLTGRNSCWGWPSTGGLWWPGRRPMGPLSLAPVLLYAAGIAWTLAYDTIYAHQDKDDDIMIGVKSTALLFGANTRPWLGGFFALTSRCSWPR